MSNIITFLPKNALKELKIDDKDVVINALHAEKFSDPVFLHLVSGNNFEFQEVDWDAFYDALLEDEAFHARLRKMLSELEPSAGEKDAPILENMLELITKGTEDNLHSEDDLSAAKTIHVSNFGGNQFSDITEFFGNGSDQFGDFLQNDSGLFVRGGGGFRLSGDFMDTGALADSEDLNDATDVFAISPAAQSQPSFIPTVEPEVDVPVNLAPLGGYDFFAGFGVDNISGNLLTDNGYGVDYDPEGDSFSIVAGTFATDQGGSITILDNGDFSYVAPTNYSGADGFDYTLLDLNGATGTGHVDFHLVNNSFSVDLSLLTISGYGGGQNASNLFSIEDGGDTITVEGNTWVSAGFDLEIVSNTVLEFDFMSTMQGEIHGIGFDNNGGIDSSRTFKLFGTQNWGNTAHNTYAGNEGEWVHYTINVGDYYTGIFDRIFFVNDDDAQVSGNGYFRNITISGGFGVGVGSSSIDDNLPAIDFDDLTFSSFSNQDYTPTVLDVDGSRIEMFGNTWKSVDYEYTLTANSTLQFDFMSADEGELHGIGLDDDNNHVTDRFIQIYGYDSYGQDGPDYTDFGSFQSFSIRLADYYEAGETYSNLTFIADDDASADAESIFDNVTIVELGTSDADVLYGNADDQVFSGLDGDDLIYAGAGDDILYGGSGIDFLYGEGGADSFVFEADSAFDAIDRIMDFDAAEGDSLDIADILSGYDPLSDAISDFVQVTSDGQHTRIAVDADGGGDDYEVIATLYGIVGLGNAQALEDDGTLITV